MTQHNRNMISFSQNQHRAWDRRSFLKGLGAVGAVACLVPRANAFRLPEDKIKVVHYFSTPGDAQGRQGQPMVNQSSNVVMIETERGLIGIGEGGEPRTIGRMCQHVDRSGSVPNRQPAATHDAWLLLSCWSGEVAFAGRT